MFVSSLLCLILFNLLYLTLFIHSICNVCENNVYSLITRCVTRTEFLSSEEAVAALASPEKKGRNREEISDKKPHIFGVLLYWI